MRRHSLTFKKEVCGSCGYTITDSAEWDCIFKFCVECTEAMVLKTKELMALNGEEDGIPELLPPRKNRILGSMNLDIEKVNSTD